MKATRTLWAGFGLVVALDQEVGADVQLTVVFLVEAGGLFQVFVHDVLGDGEPEAVADPAFSSAVGLSRSTQMGRALASSSADSISSWNRPPFKRPLSSE